MKPILFITTLLLASVAMAQQNFEGTIIYTAYSAGTTKMDTADVIVAFGKNAVLIEFSERQKKSDPSEIRHTLLRLDSGKIYTINPGNKTYRSRAMQVLPSQINYPAEKVILGYRTTAKSIRNEVLGTSTNYIEGTLYTSNDLSYAVPDKFRGIPELMIVHDSKIVLSASMRYLPMIQFDDEEDYDYQNELTERKKDEIFILEAREIKAHPVPADRLALPVDFTNLKRDDHEPWAAADSARISDAYMIADSTAAVPDTAMMTNKFIEDEPVKSTPSKPKSKPSSKTRSARKPD
jgi:hypothetical protein